MIHVNGRVLSQTVTGVQRFATEIVAALQQEGREVRLLCPAGDIDLDPRLRDCQIVRVGKRSGHLWEQIDLPAYLNRSGTPPLLNLGNTAPLRYRNNFYTLHDVTFLKYPDGYSRSFRTAYRWMSRYLCGSAKAVFTVSAFSRTEIIAAYGIDPQRIHVAHNAVPDFAARPASDKNPPMHRQDGKFVLVALSSFHANKNLGRLVEAFRRLPGRNLELHLLGGNVSAHSRELKRALQDARIKLIGRVSDAELVAHYRGASCFVIPSLYEGFGIPPLEAQACGCPVISARSSSLTEVLADSALFFDPYDVDDIAQKITQIQADEALRRELIHRGMDNVRRFSFRQSAGHIVHVMDTVASAGRI